MSVYSVGIQLPQQYVVYLCVCVCVERGVGVGQLRERKQCKEAESSLDSSHAQFSAIGVTELKLDSQ